MTKTSEALQNSNKSAQASINAIRDTSSSLSQASAEAKKEVKSALNDLLEDVESIMGKLGPAATLEVKDLMQAAKRKASAISESVQELGSEVRSQAFKGAKATRNMIRERPFQTITIAAIAGAILALLIRGRR